MKGRFAPSPSGPLHLGNLRTALLAWLFARSAGSGFVVRVEDLDAGRARPEHEAGQLADLALTAAELSGIDRLLAQHPVHGARYPEHMQALVDR